MNIDKYIKNTKEKTKKTKLPALSTLHPTPIMPDAAAGIDTFNGSFGESWLTEDLSSLKKDLESACVKFMLDKGFTQDELSQVLNVTFEDEGGSAKVSIHADLTISSLRELADDLYSIISEYDPDAYFDISANKSISVEVDMNKSLTEQFHNLDTKGFEMYSTDFGFEPLYEAMKTKLDAKDRKMLQQLLQKTDDPQEINTMMKGLLTEDDTEEESNSIRINEDAQLDSRISEIETAYKTVHDLMNQIVGEANKEGKDVLRSAADLAIGALDDFYSYSSDVKDNYDGEQTTTSDNNFDSDSRNIVDDLVYNFDEAFGSVQEYEDATDLEFNEDNVLEIVSEWLTDPYGGYDVADKDVNKVASEATKMIMRKYK
jgi:hypothetical protein